MNVKQRRDPFRHHHTAEESDALRELANVAFSHAATALSALVDTRVDVSIPSVRLDSASSVESGDAAEEGRVYVVTLRVLGDRAGALALLFPEQDALALTDMLEGIPVGTRSRMTPSTESVLKEVANVMSGSALLAMYRFLRVSLIHGTPTLHVWTRDEMERLSLLLGREDDVCLIVEAEFSVKGRVARGEMVVSLVDLRFFLDALAHYAGGV